MKGTLRAVALVLTVATSGAVAGLIVGAMMGMSSSDLSQLIVPIVVSTVVTVAAVLAANAALRSTSLRYRFLVVAVLGAGVALANLAVMAKLMLVSEHDIAIVMLLVIFGAGTAVAMAMVLASSSMKAVDRLVDGAGRIGDGDLGTRIGVLDAGPELDALARSLDAAADRLRSARQSEAQAEQMRRDLIVAVSHDLRTPLASLRAMIEAIDDGVVDDPVVVRRYAGEMRRSVEQLVAMVDDLFELTQLDAGAIRAETRRSNLDDVVRSAMAAIAPTAQLKGLEIKADLRRAVGATCSPRLVRVLQNLLVNAVRHTPAEGTVRVEAVNGDRFLTVTVEDTGEGIAAGDLERVFEPFFRADPARSGTGAGLGLALAQRIVFAMGGTIEAESEPAVGSRFAVLLPVA